MMPSGLAVPAFVVLAAIAAVILIHAVRGLYSGAKHRDDRGE